MNIRTVSLLGIMLLALAMWTGCGHVASTIYKPQFVIPPNSQVLLVDGRPGYGVPLDIGPALAKDLTAHLYKFRGAQKLVNPEKVTALKLESKDFEKFDVMTVARKTEADIIVHVDLWQFQATNVSHGLLTEGVAQALIKVVDRDGNRLWPAGEVIPYATESAVKTAPADEQDVASVRKQLLEDMTIRIGRLFHEWAKDDPYLGR